MDIFYAPSPTTNISITLPDSHNICYPLEMQLMPLDRCRVQKTVHLFSRWLAGIVATTMLPTVSFGVIANTVLACFLLFKVRRPYGHEVFGCFMAFVDGSFVLWVGGYFFLLFGSPWWTQTFETPITKSHWMCKTCMFLTDFLLNARMNLPMFALFHQLQYTHYNPKNPRLCVFAKCALATGLAVVIAGPGWVIFGVWQQFGVFICRTDPQWGSAYHNFYLVHSLLFTHGLIQSICSVCMLYILSTRMREVQCIRKFLQTISAGSDPISLIVLGLNYKLSDLYRNYRILFTQSVTVVTNRLLLCGTRAAIIISTPNVKGSHTGIIAWEAVWNWVLFFEILMACFPFVVWHANLKEMQWRRLIRKKTLQEPHIVFQTNSTNYFHYALFKTETAARHISKCIDATNALKFHEDKLRKALSH